MTDQAQESEYLVSRICGLPVTCLFEKKHQHNELVITNLVPLVSDAFYWSH
jgi:hypothetical protein